MMKVFVCAILFASAILTVVVSGWSGGPGIRKEEGLLDNGIMGGTGAEFFRYMNVYEKRPTDADKDVALHLADEIRCDVCQIITEDLISKASSWSEDALLDVFEGASDYVRRDLPADEEDEEKKARWPVEQQVQQHKSGCNKHFKDSFLYLGHFIEPCEEGVKESKACIGKHDHAPSSHSVETYEVWKEGVWRSCEQTIAMNRDDMVETVLEYKAKGVEEAARKACKQAAKCSKKLSSKKKSKGKTRVEL